MSEQPDIILLLADQLRFDALGIAGNEAVATPNLDALAADGAWFRRAYASTPSCPPARAALLTGRSPWGHGLLGPFAVGSHYEHELPRTLRDGGYHTFLIGKGGFNHPRNIHGFHGALLDDSFDADDPFAPSAEYTSDYRQWFLANAPGLDPDATRLGRLEREGRAYALAERLHPTRWTGDRAVELITSYALPRPLFLTVSFSRPHGPYDPPARFVAPDPSAGTAAEPGWLQPVVGDWAAGYAKRELPWLPARDSPYGDLGVAKAVQIRRHYAGSVAFIDEQIGRIVEALRDRGTYDRSLILFASDHGDMLGDHHHWRAGHPFEASARVPFIVKAPAGIAEPRPEGLDALIELRDVFPTLIEAAGMQRPLRMDGRSVLPLLREPGTPWRSLVAIGQAYSHEYGGFWEALTDGAAKYIWYYHTGAERLFDLASDPHERTDRVADLALAGDLERWRALMAEHLGGRGEPWVRDGRIQVFAESFMASRNYPDEVRLPRSIARLGHPTAGSPV